jgi:hypothetical protein
VKLADAIKTARGVKFSHAQKFAQHVVPEVVRPARIIWNQAIGALFALLALAALNSAFKFINIRTGVVSNAAYLALSLCFTAVMTFFAVTSFLKARRIGRRGR